MQRSVKSWAKQLGHACINDDKLSFLRLLDIKAACDERTALADDCSAELEVKMLAGTQLQVLGVCLEVGFEVWNRMLVRIFVVDS